MKIAKLISLVVFCIMQVNVIFCQMVTKNERIIWNTIPDSILLSSGLFNNSSFDENYNTLVFTNRYSLPKHNYNVSFSNIEYTAAEAQEISFLEQRGVVLTDSIQYTFHPSLQKNTNLINANIAILPYISRNGNIQRIISYSVIFTPTTPYTADNTTRKSTNPYPAHSVLSSGKWYKLTIANTGIHKISGSDLVAQNIDITNLAISNLRIYGNGGNALSEKNTDFEYNDLIENAIYVKDNNNNGLFDTNDYILFYAQAANIWKYNNSSKLFEYQVHPYSKYNYYFLSISGNNNSPKRISTFDFQESTTENILSYTYCATIHNDITNTHQSGRIWVGEKFSSAVSSRSFSFSIPNTIQGANTGIKYALSSVSNTNSSFKVSINGASQNHYFSQGNRYMYQGVIRNIQLGSSGKCNIEISYSFNESMAAGYLDYIEINAPSALSFTESQTPFRHISQNDSSCFYQFQLGNSSQKVRVWNIGNPCNVYELSTTLNNNISTFTDSCLQYGQWVAFDGSSFYSPTAISAIDNQDLHGMPQADYIIVAPEIFLSQAERLAQLHRLYNGLDVAVITPQKIYNEFSSGKQDAMAIRRFLKMLYDRALTDNNLKMPRYLLLFGKAIYDNKNITNTDIPFVVSYQSETSFDTEGSSFTSDDMFGYLGDWETGSIYESIDVGIGRFPVKTTNEAKTMVDKVEYYLTKKDLQEVNYRGDWRNYITFLADDADPGSENDVYFITSSEKTTQLINQTYPLFNVEKIYADAYVQQSSAIGSFYPEAKNALTKRINNGCLLLNYVGHGSIQYIGTERYMEKNDIASYSNKYQLPFFVASTCSFGKYDIIDDICGAESFVLAPNGGGIAITAAVRPIGHSETFDTKVCLYALDKNNSIGDAFRIAKNEACMTHSMQLLGDPAIKLSLPENQIVVTAINNKPTTDNNADTATVLTRVVVEGEIRNNSNNIISDFSGQIYSTVFDRFVTYKTLANDNEDTEMEFSQQKNILYKGRDSVINGKFSYSFIVPKDVVFQYDYGKLSHYANSYTEDATGSYSNILFGGFNQDIDIVESRPGIRLFMNDSLFVSGGTTNQNPTIYAILYDTLGINAVGSGIGHDITAVLDGNSNRIMVLNDYYETDATNPHKGYVSYPLQNLENGLHQITLKAWNIYNYSASATIVFNVVDNQIFHIGNFYAYPNPANWQTTFRLEHNQPDQITGIEIQIYSTMGQLVKTLYPPVVEGSYAMPEVVWDFTSDSGYKVANGMYLARIIITTSDNQKHSVSTKIMHNDR